jgi:hypothetical protein
MGTPHIVLQVASCNELSVVMKIIEIEKYNKQNYFA